MRDAAVLVAPSGPMAEETLDSGLAALEELGIPWTFPASGREGALARRGWTAGDDEHRAACLRDAVRCGARGVWMIRGGYGAIRTLEAAGPELFEGAEPTALWGFSDGTLLLGAWAKAGWPAWSAPPLSQLPRLDLESLARVRAAWHADHLAPIGALGTLVPGQARAPLAGGNLCMLASALGTPYEVDLRDRIVVLEDTGEPPYRVDRLFTQLRQAGAFEGAAAVIAGAFTNVSAENKRGIAELFEAELPRLGLPIVTGLPVGHADRNFPLPFGPATGWMACLDAPADGPATLTFERSP